MNRFSTPFRRISSFAMLALVAAVGTLALSTATASASMLTDPSPAAASIWSDQADYGPGATVTLMGAAWQPGESVHILVNDDTGATWSHSADVTADVNGNISDVFNLPDWFVATYSVTATGDVSGTARSCRIRPRSTSTPR